MKKRTIETIRPYFEEKNMELVSKEYKNVDTDLEYICNNHKEIGVQRIKFRNILKGRYCPCCMLDDGLYVNKIPEFIVKRDVENAGLIYKGTYTKNQHSYINFICNKHEEIGVQSEKYMHLRHGVGGCRYCNAGHEKSKIEFNSRITDIFNGMIEVVGEYKAAKKKIKVKCKKHNYEWEPLAYNLLSGFGCPLCGREIIGIKRSVPREELSNRLKGLKNIKVITEVTEDLRTYDNIKCQCKKCNKIWEATIINLTKTYKPTRCPYCNMSKGEERVCDFLDMMDINYEQQKRFYDCKDKNPLPFDFYLTDFNTLIEYDGEGHYFPIFRNEDKEKAYKDYYKVGLHDDIKTAYCIDNNINLIRIPYWELDDLDYYLFKQFEKYGIITEVKEII